MARRVIQTLGGHGATHAPVFSPSLPTSLVEYPIIRMMVLGTGSPIITLSFQFFKEAEAPVDDGKWKTIYTKELTGISTKDDAFVTTVSKDKLPDGGVCRYGISVAGTGDYRVNTELWVDEATFGVLGDPKKLDDKIDLTKTTPITKYKVPKVPKTPTIM